MDIINDLMEDYDERYNVYDFVFDCSPAQYHAGINKLWKALGLTEPQDKDIFTIAAETIVELKEENAAMRELT